MKMSPTFTNMFFAFLNASFTKNYIGSNTIIADKDTTVLNNIELNKGSRITYPINLDGYLNISSFIMYGLPVEFLKSNVNFNLNAGYSHAPSVVNGVTNYTGSTTLGAGLTMSNNIGEDIDFTISSNSNFTSTKNNLTSGSKYFTQNSQLNFYWDVWNGLVFQNEISHQYNGDAPDLFDKNIVFWNVSIGKKLLTKNKGEIKFSVTDVLNQNTNIKHNINDLYTENVKTNALGRYFLLSFIYNITSFNI